MISAIYDRRSIRRFSDKPVSEQDMREIFESGIKAPSSKNRQPWKYIVLSERAKREMLSVFRKGIEREEIKPLLPGSREHIVAAKQTVRIMESAPVIVFVVNMLGKSVLETATPEERIAEACNIQSIGASVQNMLLAAWEKGIGSLWVCDIYFAYPELCAWLQEDGALIAAIAFGYPDETPGARPRRKAEETVVWRT